MDNPEFELFDLIPISTSSHTKIELALALSGTRELRPMHIFDSHDKLLAEIIRCDGTDDAKSAVERKLQESPVYKNWQKSMPYLKQVPKIHDYRHQKRRIDLVAVNEELMNNGGFLQQGQILFRGSNYAPDQTLITNTPISTSMHPSVAVWHARRNKGHLSILQVAASKAILGFAYKVYGNQKHKGEYEVLLQSNLRLEQTSRCIIDNFEVRSYDVYSNAA